MATAASHPAAVAVGGAMACTVAPALTKKYFVLPPSTCAEYAKRPSAAVCVISHRSDEQQTLTATHAMLDAPPPLCGTRMQLVAIERDTRMLAHHACVAASTASWLDSPADARSKTPSAGSGTATANDALIGSASTVVASSLLHAVASAAEPSRGK